MKTPYELLNNKKFYNSKKIGDKSLHFNAFTGYHPVIKALKKQGCYSLGGAFKWMFIEAKKPKFFSVMKNSDGDIISLCFIIYDSWIVGNRSKETDMIGSIGYFTKHHHRGNGYCRTVTEYMRDNIKDIIPEYENYKLCSQDRVSEFTETIFGLKTDPFSCTDNSGYFMWACKPRHVYSINFEKMYNNVYRKKYGF